MHWALLAVLLLLSEQTPIFRTSENNKFYNNINELNHKVCLLPPDLDFVGNVTFLLDCKTFDRQHLQCIMDM